MDTYRGFNSVDNHWNSMISTHHHKERYVYDPNGNIVKAFRNSNITATPAMDSLSYYYTAGTNRLDHIRDSVPDASYGASTDIKNQSPGNYQYDAIGNLKSSGFRSLNEIKWNVYGKITEITKASGYLANSRFIKYNYDPSGNRIGQAHRFGAGAGTYDYTWQVRDAQGNVMAVYQVKGAANASAGTLKLTEHYIYGSSRLGMINRDINADLPKHTVENPTNLGDAYLINFTRGNKLFELTNHLGNVLATVSDVKFPVAQPGSPSVVGSYTGELVSAIDYSPFGMQLPGRIYNNQYARYRYGFNGQEMDNEVMGPTNSYNAEFWQYDPRVGRRWNVDPVTNPSESPYSAFANSPILVTDTRGNCPDGNCGDKEVVAAYEIVKKDFSPKKNLNDIKDKLKLSATEWFANQYATGGYPKDIKNNAYAAFESLVMATWENAIASSFWEKYESNDKLIQNMSTESGKALAIQTLTGKDKKDFDAFNQLVLPNIVEFFGVGAGASNPALNGPTKSVSKASSFALNESSKLFAGVPQGAGALLGQRGEDLTELMLRRAYPNATIAKQVYYYFSKKSYTKLDFVVINEGKVIAIWESKVNQAKMTGPQELFFIEKKVGTFGGKVATESGIAGKTAEGSIKGTATYNSTTGSATLNKY